MITQKAHCLEILYERKLCDSNLITIKHAIDNLLYVPLQKIPISANQCYLGCA